MRRRADAASRWLPGLGLLVAVALIASLGPRPARADVAPLPELTPTPVVQPAAPGDPGPGVVLRLPFDALVVNRGTAAWLESAFRTGASRDEVRAVLIELDTPGGVLSDTRQIVKAMLASEVPVIVWVGPAGSRAGSAGVFLTVAAHVAAMAPSTNIGAAHPVTLGPSLPTPVQGPGADEPAEPDEQARDSATAMLEKVTNDTVAWGRGLADRRGRNADWVERAIRESVSIGDVEALELGVVDLVAPTVTDLLEQAEGRIVELADGRRIRLRTRGSTVEDLPMSAAQQALRVLTDPTLAYLLLVAGLIGLWIEFKSPGMLVPGGLGALSLLLAAFSLSALPVNALAVVFVVLGFALLIAEFYVPSLGLLTVGGLSAIAFGGLFLIDKSADYPAGVSPAVIAALVGCVGLVAAGLGWLLLGDRGRQVLGGSAGMVGEAGVVCAAIRPGGPGAIKVHGERWRARAAVEVPVGSAVTVVAVDGLTVEVEPAEG